MEKTKLKSKAGKSVYKTDEGELVSEKTIGVEMDGKEYTIPTVYKGKILEDKEAIDLFRKGKIKPVAVSDSPEEGDKKAEQRSKGLLDMNIGGAPRKNLEAQQLEMFGDIGMAKSPAKKDPISGNEIPKASTAEEVRDDIPAKLSEGEFVLPADVVRYHGLEKLMNLRQQAKQGINTMDKMGQLGNSEEATMPDDLPFDINDIEMAEGGMVNVAGQPMQLPRIAGKQMEMQTGGFVNPTGTYQVPTNIATTPSYFQNYAQTTAPFKPFVPQNQTAIPPVAPVTPPRTTGPSFQTLIPSEGQRPVTKEYRNAAGQKLFIPFINNKPIYPIPEGYTEYVEEETPIAEDKPAVTTPTTTITGDGGDSDTRVGTVIGKTGKGKTPTEESVTSKTQAVLSGLQQNTPKSTLSKAFNVVAKGLMGTMVPGMGLLGGALTGGKAYFGDDQGPSTQGLADALGSFDAAQGIGYDAKGNVTVSGPMANVMGIQGVMNELSKAAYGKSYGVMTQELGVQPSFQYGYKPGDVDPSTNATYSANGQATDDDNNVSYTDMNAFGNAMNASAKSGYFGGEKQAKEDAKNNNPKAKSFLGYLEINTLSDKESFTGSKDDTFGYSESQGTSTGDTATDTSISDVGSEEDPESTTSTSSSETDSGQSGDGGSDGPDGATSDSHICTATYNNGYIDKEHFTTLRKYGIMLRKTDPYMMKAYDMFGPMLASYVHKNKYMTSFAKFITQYYKDTMDNKKLNTKQNVFKFVSKNILRPTYRIIGWTAQKLSK